MDKKLAAARKAQEVRGRIQQFAEQLRNEVYGARGYPDWGTLFSEIEELGVEIGDAVCREFIQQSVTEQAEDQQSGGQHECCPTCGRTLEPQEPEPKPLLTRRGEVCWQEPQTYCKKCRKAFFPSVQKLGDSRGGKLQP